MRPVSSSLLQNIAGSVSAVASFTVCLTYWVFKDIRNLRYVELVFYVAINDLVASVGMALGGSETGSFVCWFQAIVTNVQYLAAMFWSTVIAYQLWLAVHENKTIQDMTYIHVFVWIFPVIVTFLPLTTNTFGNADDSSTWCFVSNTSYSPSWGIVFWDIVSYYLWVWLSTLASFYFIISSWYALQRAPQETELQQKSVALTKVKVRRLVLYPIIVSVCWVISTVTDLIDAYARHVNLHWVNAAIFFSILQGIFFSIVFFVMNPMIRHRWTVLFENCYYQIKGLFIEQNPDDRNNSKSTERNTMPGRDTVAVVGERSFAYSIEEEPDYIGPRSKSLNDVTAVEMQSTYVRPSWFSTTSPIGFNKQVSSGAIRNPVVKQTSSNNVSVDVADIRDSEMSVDDDV